MILRACSKGGEFEIVEEAFDEMLLRGLEPIPRGTSRRWAGGATRLVRAGCPADVTTFSVVVAGCVSAEEMDARWRSSDGWRRNETGRSTAPPHGAGRTTKVTRFLPT